MKGRVVLSLFFLRCICFLYGGETGEASLLPREVFVGDHAEVRYVFVCEACTLKGSAKTLDAEFLETLLTGGGENSSFSLTGAELRLLPDKSFSVSIRFVPWKTGPIDFVPFDINLLLADKEGPVPACIVDIPPVYINSMVEKLGVSQIRPPEPPLLIPGTTYIIYGIIILCLAAAALAAMAAIRLAGIRRFLRFRLERARLIRSYRTGMKRLKKLGKNKHADLKYCAAQVQAVFRQYLEIRFGISFAAAASPEILPLIYRIMGDVPDRAVQRVLDMVDSLFTRCDYIRYASVSEKAGETARLLHSAADCLTALEKGCTEEGGVS